MSPAVLERSVPARAATGRRPVRIGFVIDNLSRAGTESQLLALIEHLDRARFEPSLVLLDGSSAESRELEPADCEVLRLGVTRLGSIAGLRAALRLRAHWKRRRPDIVQAYFLDASYFAIPMARWLGVPKIVRVRNNLGYWLTRRHRLMNRLIRGLVDVALTNSEGGRERLVHGDGLRPDRVVAIGNGVDLDRFASVRPPRFLPPVRVGCVANLRAVKNVDGLMRAAHGVLERFPDTVFAVAGEGEQRAALERLHGELGLGDRFVLCGSVKDVPAFLDACDLVVLPSHSEGMSNALLESMAAGRAIVATDVGDNGKLLRHDREGWIVPDSRPESLAAGLRHLLSDLPRAREMASAARDRAERDFGRGAMVRRFEAFFESLAFGETIAGRGVGLPIECEPAGRLR